VLIDDYYQRLVGYIVADVRDQDTGETYRLPQGTVFFVEIHLSKSHLGTFGYAVTCRHVLEGMHERGYGDGFIRLNRRSHPGIYDHPFRFEDWTRSKTSDLAVCAVSIPVEADYWFYPMYGFSSGLALGQDIFFVGLFSARPGVDSVDALVRSGKVAREYAKVALTVNDIARESIETTVHIVESRSWGGESGSPVFIYDEKWKLEQGYQIGGFSSQDRVVPDVHPKLLGVMHGHYQIPADVMNAGETAGGVDINSGIAIVIPCVHLTELIMQDHLIKERQRDEDRREERARRSSMPKPD
jgi:hypothetical protein